MDNEYATKAPPPRPPPSPNPPATDAAAAPPIEPSSFSGFATPWPGFALSPYPPVPVRGQAALKGLKHLRWGVDLVIGSTTLSVLVTFFLLLQMLTLRNGILTRDLGVLLAADRWYLAALVTGLFAAIVAIGGVILGVAGFSSLARSSSDFGQDHARSVKIALVLAGLAAAAQVGLFVFRLRQLNTIDELPESATVQDLITFLDGYYVFLPIEAFLIFVVTLTAGLAMVTIVARLVPARGRRRSVAFIAMSLIASFLVFAVAFSFGSMVGPVGGYTVDPEAFVAGFLAFVEASILMMLVYLVAGAFSFGSLVVYVGVLRDAERGVNAMVAEGGTDPDARAERWQRPPPWLQAGGSP